MANPVVTVTLNAVDISADVSGSPSLRYGRGANFDGSQEAPGYCVLSVRNDARKYNPYNASSPIYASLRINKKVRVTAVYSAVTYYLFDGFLSRIVVMPDSDYAELHCVDALDWYGRKETSVTASYLRSISGFRTAILDDIGEAAGNRTLSSGSAEWATPLTDADQANALGVLTELNLATGSLHYIEPDATAYNYTTVSRVELQSVASVETYSDTDLTLPFFTSLDDLDYSYEGLVNTQRVKVEGRATPSAMTVVWDLSGRVVVNRGTSTTVWATFSNPVFESALSYTATGAPTSVVMTAFSRSAKVVITAAAGAETEILKMSIMARPAEPPADDQSVQRTDATSITDYGIHIGSPVNSRYIAQSSEANGLASWIIYRYAIPRPDPSGAIVNRFPSQLQREPGDRITLTASELSSSAREFFVRGFETQISDHGAVWTTTYRYTEAPTLLSLFTIGGTAAQGVGGSAILGY